MDQEVTKSFASQKDKLSFSLTPHGPRSTNLRWVTLFLLSFACIGCYFSVDLTQSMMNIVMEELDLKTFEYNVIFSVYSLPNIVLPFVGGLIVDYMGVRVAFAFFSFVIILGQIVATFGAYQKQFSYMLAGQFIFAIGGDCLLVAKSSMVSKWFRGKELALALSAGLCVGRLGSSLDSFMSPKVYEKSKKLYLPYLISVFLCIFSFIVVLIMNYIDKKTDDAENVQSGNTEPKQKPTWKDFKRFPRVYYFLILNCGSLYLGFYGFVNNISDILINRFGFTRSTAGNVVPIIFITPVILTPIVGFMIDKYGKRALVMLIACILYFIDHFVIAFFPDSKPGEADYRVIGMLIVLGIFYSAYAAVFWPCIALVVKPKMTGVAYGFTLVFQNIVLMIGPLVIGKIHDSTEEVKSGYFWTQIALAIVVGFGIIVTTVIYILDMRGNKVLNNPSKHAQESLIDHSNHEDSEN